MTERIVLPTFEIVTECLAFDPIFFFLPNGVKDVIREAVENSSFHRRHRSTNGYPYRSDLVAYLLDRFDDYFAQQDAAYEENPTLTRDERLADYHRSAGAIEIVTLDVEEMVFDMMDHLMHSQLFEVIENSAKWHQRDLLVDIRGLSRSRRR